MTRKGNGETSLAGESSGDPYHYTTFSFPRLVIGTYRFLEIRMDWITRREEMDGVLDEMDE